MTIEEYNAEPKRCKCCLSEIPYSKRQNQFCNRSCSAKFVNKISPKRPRGKYSKKPCLVCKKETDNTKFCSGKCFFANNWNLRKNEILSNGEFKYSYDAKKFISETDGYKCKICGISEWCDQKLSLILDHINGNADDWKIENLRLLCPNCDSQTPTFKGRNFGKGRFSRRQRYKNGQSY